MKLVIGCMLLATIVLTACKKDKEAEETPFSGEIVLTTPTNGTNIVGETTFQITGSVSGNKEMHGFVLTVYNANDQSVVYTTQHSNHATAYTINETVTHNLTVSTPLRLVIEVEIDHDAAPMTKEVLFEFQP